MFVDRVYVPKELAPNHAARERWPLAVPCVAEVVGAGLDVRRPVVFPVGDKRVGEVNAG